LSAAGEPLRDQIALTVARYARAVDSRDWDLLGSCFTEDAEVVYRGYNSYDGRDAVVAGCRRSLVRFRETRHLLGDCAVEFNADPMGADSRCYLIATHLRDEPDGETSRFTLGGTYADRLVLRDGAWLIRERILDQEWASGDPRAMRWD